jgi:hypothetical protein
MRYYIFLPLLLVMIFSENKCTRENTGKVYKGKLEIKGICMNYTIRLLEGSIDTTRIEADWKDEVTGKTYQDVFALGSVCDFPSTINEGDEFYFSINPSAAGNCAVCLAYYPKPRKSLRIKVVKK